MILKQMLVNLFNKYMDYKILFDDYIVMRKKGTPKIMKVEDTIEYIMENNCSVCRYGDGEFKLISGERIYFQEYDELLSTRLKDILLKDKKNMLVCLPDMFEKTNRYLQPHKKYIDRIIALNRSEWYKIIDMNRIYGNSFLSRGYQIWKDKSNSELWFEKTKGIWKNKDLVFIEGEKSRLGCGNDLFSNANSIERILCPQMNAFSYYNEILEEAKKIDKEKMIILALGPTATVLADDLNEVGYQVLDLGHIDIEYEWYLCKATSKVKIKGKFISEAKGGTQVEDVFDLTYENQIIKKIGV